MTKYTEYVKWFGTVMFISAAILLSSNIEVSRFGFFMFLFGHIALSFLFYRIKDYALFCQNFIFIFVDAFGIYRWFIA